MNENMLLVPGFPVIHFTDSVTELRTSKSYLFAFTKKSRNECRLVAVCNITYSFPDTKKDRVSNSSTSFGSP